MGRPTILLDSKLVEYARNLAKKITDDVQSVIDEHSTVSTERATLRLLGVDGVVGEERIPW